MTTGKLIVIVFLAVVLATGVASTLVMIDGAANVRSNQAGIGLAMVWKAAAVWAEEHEGRYPEHMALLLPNNYFRAKLLLDPREPGGTVWTVGEGDLAVDAKPYVEEMRGDKAARGMELLDRGLLERAIASIADRPIYRFGDYWFVRNAMWKNRADLIFGWALPDPDGRRFIVSENGDARKVDAAGWNEAWRRDAAARAELGWPAITPPSGAEG